MTSQEQTNNASGNQSVKGGRIVAGIDGSPVSLMALEWAARQAEYTDSSLEVVAAWEWPTSFGWSFIPDGYDPARDMAETLEPVLE